MKLSDRKHYIFFYLKQILPLLLAGIVFLLMLFFLPVLLTAETKMKQSFFNLSDEEKNLLQEFRTAVPLLVKKYSQLSLEYRRESQGKGWRKPEISRIFIREGGYYRWDIESDKGTLIHLVLPERCYRIGKKKGSDTYTLITKGGADESKKTALMILSSDVVRSPFATGPVPIWYGFDILDDPSLDRSVQGMFESSGTATEYVSVKQTVGNAGENLVTIIQKTNNEKEQQQFSTVFDRNRSWALKSINGYAYDESGKKLYTNESRDYEGESDGFPLLKQVSDLVFFDENNKEPAWGDIFFVVKLELSPPPLSVFDPKQFFPIEVVAPPRAAYWSWGRIFLIFTGIVLIVWAVWMKIKTKQNH
jgi:hypothetical protein